MQAVNQHLQKNIFFFLNMQFLFSLRQKVPKLETNLVASVILCLIAFSITFFKQGTNDFSEYCFLNIYLFYETVLYQGMLERHLSL